MKWNIPEVSSYNWRLALDSPQYRAELPNLSKLVASPEKHVRDPGYMGVQNTYK